MSPVIALAKSEPIQFSLGGEWLDGNQSLSDAAYIPRSFTVPEGKTMVIRYVTCQGLINPGTTAFIHFLVDDENEAPELALIPTASSAFSFGQDRIAATVNTEIYMGIANKEGPAVGTTIAIYAQREVTSGIGGITCLLSGETNP
jgi:hypothetical protein